MTLALAFLAFTMGALFLAYFFRELPRRMALQCLFPAACLLYHSLGYLLPRFFLPRNEFSSLLQDAGLEESDLNPAFLLVICAMLFACLIGWRMRNLFSIPAAELRGITHRAVSSRAFVVVMGMVIALQSFLIISGNYGISGVIYNQETGHISPLAQVLYPVPHFTLLIIGSTMATNRKMAAKLIVLVFEVCLIFLGGRTSLAIGLLFFYIGLRLSGLRFGKETVSILIIGLTFYF